MSQPRKTGQYAMRGLLDIHRADDSVTPVKIKLILVALAGAFAGASVVYLIPPRTGPYTVHTLSNGSGYRLDSRTGEVVWFYMDKHYVSLKPGSPGFEFDPYAPFSIVDDKTTSARPSAKEVFDKKP